MAGNVAPNITTDGLVLYLDAANTKSYLPNSIIWNDLSISGKTGTLINTPSFSSINNGTLVFNGTNQYIDNIGTINDYNFFFSTGTFSVSFWIKRSLNNTRQVIAGTTTTNVDKGWYVIVEYGIVENGNNCLSFHVAGGAANTRLIHGNTDDNTIGTSWTHCTYTCQNPDKLGQWYINGVSVNTTLRVQASGNGIQGTYYNGPSTRTINIGRPNSSSTVLPFNGNISQFLIYQKQLSPSEVLQNYNATKGRYL